MGQDRDNNGPDRRRSGWIPRTLGDTSTLVGMTAVLLGGIISGLAWVRGEDVRELRDLVQHEADTRGGEDGHIMGTIRALEHRTEAMTAEIREVENRIITRMDAMETKLGHRIDTIYLFQDPRVRESGGNVASPVDCDTGGV